MRIFARMFPMHIGLEIPKRFKTAEQNERILLIKNDILSGMYVEDLFAKWFKPIQKITQLRGACVAYRDEVARIVDEYIHNSHKPSQTFHGYYEGMMLQCREALRVGAKRMTRNFKYVVESVGESFVLRDHDGEKWTVKFNDVRKYFRYAYCFTGHVVE